MASSGVTFTQNSTTYVADLEMLRNFSELWATNIETAQGGETSLNAKFDLYIPLSGVGSNPDMNAKRIVNVADPVDAQDVATAAYVASEVAGGGTPSAIPVTSLGVGTATSLQLLRINSGGTAPEGFTLDLDSDFKKFGNK